jgi:hypothetical protein
VNPYPIQGFTPSLKKGLVLLSVSLWFSVYLCVTVLILVTQRLAEGKEVCGAFLT